MGISVISALYMVSFVSMVASSVRGPPTWGGGDKNMQLVTCDSILVGNSKQGILSANYLTLELCMPLDKAWSSVLFY